MEVESLHPVGRSEQAKSRRIVVFFRMMWGGDGVRAGNGRNSVTLGGAGRGVNGVSDHDHERRAARSGA